MRERHVDIATRDGGMGCFVVHPDEDFPLPVVLVYMDAFGIREELRDMARRFASAGHYVMLPDLFYRDGGPSFDPAQAEGDRYDPRMTALNAALTLDMTVDDTAALLAFADQDVAASREVAAVGYCMGGRHALAAAAAHPARIKAMASLHGGQLVNDTPRSPHLRIAQLRCEAYFGWADQDPVAPEAHRVAVVQALAARGLPHRVELHPGARHGFTFAGRPAYHKDAAEQVWARLFAMFRRTLARPAISSHVPVHPTAVTTRPSIQQEKP